MLLDLTQFCRSLATRRNKGAVLLTPDVREQSALAALIASVTGAKHLDVLNLFQSDAGFIKRLPAFSMADFFAIINQQKTKSLLIISGLEFLLAVWLCQGDPKQVKRDLCSRIELWDDGDKPPFLLLTQHDPVFAAYEPARHRGSQLIIELSQTQALS